MEICTFKNDRININEYVESVHKGNITCPCCESLVIAKRGEFKQHHFAHKSKSDCDSWYGMSEWHSQWQNQFPKEFREVVCISNGEKHRADIKINHLIIEFQNSNISNWDFCERNDFYTANGDLLVWLFNLDNGYGFSTLNLYKPSDRILCFTEREGFIYCPLENKYTKEEFIKLLRHFYKENNFEFVYNEMERLEMEQDWKEKEAAFLHYKRDRYAYETGRLKNLDESEEKRYEFLYNTYWIIKDKLIHTEKIKDDYQYGEMWHFEKRYQAYKSFRLQKEEEAKILCENREREQREIANQKRIEKEEEIERIKQQYEKYRIYL